MKVQNFLVPSKIRFVYQNSDKNDLKSRLQLKIIKLMNSKLKCDNMCNIFMINGHCQLLNGLSHVPCTHIG